ncbi:leucyl/phenylalanyl-tRNA--protein transferase [Guyparkeria hydrothermalis]|uniref:leucyl/phenylalanyl-tRNA--protein transferase n=1 Tax=Guyparkeria hydrothermalis TaxID=923 RepID=UPI002022429E|nr:leucyl/phenylalanyl-tRNA--protein transferase [Guyparkeria hydrothermalis]MCL7744501.1 leucyl/phenylalanyl-tRNA--protein transferase [Guyparkeria hydrothermalis]
MIPLLGPDPKAFPPVTSALSEPNGLLAAGGDLSVARLEAAYHHGIFPWYSEGDPILWWSPDPRILFTPERFHVSRSLAKWRRQGRYRVTVDTAFADVVDGCAAPRDREPGTWIVPAMRRAFLDLHAAGIAHSVEVWDGDELVGGVFGSRIGRAAFGESMFSHAPNASKFALAAILVDRAWGDIAFLDAQFSTEHLLSLGAEEYPRSVFVRWLAEAATESPGCGKT